MYINAVQHTGMYKNAVEQQDACCRSQTLVVLADIQPALSQKPAPVAKPLPISTKCLNDVLDLSPRCQNVGSFSDITAPRCGYSSRVRRSLTLGRQSQTSKGMLPDILVGRHKRPDDV